MPFELYVDYCCPVAAVATQAVPTAELKHLHDCFEESGCSDDLPMHCEDSLPENPQRVQTIDPDGFVFDVASVNAGAMMTQSIITQA